MHVEMQRDCNGNPLMFYNSGGRSFVLYVKRREKKK